MLISNAKLSFGIKRYKSNRTEKQCIWQWQWSILKVWKSLRNSYVDRIKQIWYLSPMRAAKVQASLRVRAVSPEPSLLAHTSSESRGTFRQKARSLAPLNGWACAVKICHDGMLEDTNSLDGAHIREWIWKKKLLALKLALYWEYFPKNIQWACNCRCILPARKYLQINTLFVFKWWECTTTLKHATSMRFNEVQRMRKKKNTVLGFRQWFSEILFLILARMWVYPLP